MIFLCFVLFTLSFSSLVHVCQHDHLEPVERRSMSFGDSNLRRADMESIRITSQTDVLYNFSDNADLIPYIIDFVDDAMEDMEDILSVVPVADFYLERPTPACNEYDDVDPTDCIDPNTVTCGTLDGDYFYIPVGDMWGELKVNGEMVGRKFANTDVLAYIVSIQDTNCDNGAAAWALSCATNADDGRPTVGLVNFCPRMHTSSGIRDITTSDFSDESFSHLLKGVFLHEFTHLLGFSNSLYEDYLDPTGNPWVEYWREVTEDGHEVTRFVTPTAIEKNEELFGCSESSIEGVELEDGGGSGTALSHTECRLYPEDFMNGAIYDNYKLSPISFSILDDSGWYDVDYTKLEDLEEFAGEGCDAAVEGSGQWDFPCYYYVYAAANIKSVMITVLLAVAALLL